MSDKKNSEARCAADQDGDDKPREKQVADESAPRPDRRPVGVWGTIN